VQHLGDPRVKLERSKIRIGLGPPKSVTAETSLRRAIRGNASDRGWFHPVGSGFVRDSVPANAPAFDIRLTGEASSRLVMLISLS